MTRAWLVPVFACGLGLASATAARADLAAGIEAYGQGDFAAAIEALELPAEGGDGRAQYYLGLSYNFRARDANDLARAARWWRRAAEQGHGESQYALALLYLDGRGIKRSRADAMYWFRRAVVNGVSEASYFLPGGGGQ